MIKNSSNNDDYQLLIDKVDTYFNDSNIVLQDDRNTIKEIEFNGQKLVIKSFKKPILLNRFVYSYLKKSKARRAYEFGLKIADFSPQVIAYIEYYQHYLLNKSYFICQKFDFDFNIRAPLSDKTFKNRQAIFKQFAKFIHQLHRQNIIHQDLSPGNILIKKNHQNHQFNIIDTNRMDFKGLNIKQRAKNFNKLWADDSDLSIILKEYAKIGEFDADYFIKLGLKYNQQLKQRKTAKKKIKQLFGLC